MEGRVGLVGWPKANTLFTGHKNRLGGKLRRPKNDILNTKLRRLRGRDYSTIRLP